jgi:hypothetical protein
LELVGFFFNADCLGETWSLESQLLDICGGVEVLSQKIMAIDFFI